MMHHQKLAERKTMIQAEITTTNARHVDKPRLEAQKSLWTWKSIAMFFGVCNSNHIYLGKWIVIWVSGIGIPFCMVKA